MRIAAPLLVAFLVAACQTPATPSSSPAVGSPITVVSPTLEPSPSPATELSPAPTARPSPNPAEDPVTIRLPVTACPTSTGTDETPPSPPAEVDVAVAASLVGRLAAFGDGYDLILAPAGWTCEAQIGADGSTSIRAWPPGGGAAQVTSETNGRCYGCGLVIACSTFAVASEQYAVDFGLCDPQRPPDEVVTAETAELIAFADPPGVAGTGIGSGGAYAASGLVWFTSDGDTILASRTTCTLAPADTVLCAPILEFARSLLPDPPAGSPPAEIVALAPPAP